MPICTKLIVRFLILPNYNKTQHTGLILGGIVKLESPLRRVWVPFAMSNGRQLHLQCGRILLLAILWLDAISQFAHFGANEPYLQRRDPVVPIVHR